MIGVSQPKKPGRRKQATYAPVSSGSAIYSVSSTNETFVNTPPCITSESDVEVFEDEIFQFKLSAEDSEDKTSHSWLMRLHQHRWAMCGWNTGRMTSQHSLLKASC